MNKEWETGTSDNAPRATVRSRLLQTSPEAAVIYNDIILYCNLM